MNTVLKKICRAVIATILLLSFMAPVPADTLVASFEDDMRPGGLPLPSFHSGGNWVYGWNAYGALEAPGTFEWLVSSGHPLSLYNSDGSYGLPGGPPGAYTFIGYLDPGLARAGGHPGQRLLQNPYERYVIALFVLPMDGYFEIRNSFIKMDNPFAIYGDGLSFFVGVYGYLFSAQGMIPAGYQNSASFDLALGYHTAGEFVIVGIGSRGTDYYDGFHMDFDIVKIPNPMSIDIKPGSDPNCFNINGRGVIPVAILGSDTFDVKTIDKESLLFAGLAVRARGNKGPLCGFEDTNGDGFIDLVCHFQDDATDWDAGRDEATLTGKLREGSEIEGTDTICMVP